MSVLEIVCAILIVVMILPIITYIEGIFSSVIPTALMTIFNAFIILKLILFIIHRGDEG